MKAKNLKKIISHLPDAAGVYLMKDVKGAIISIGKAKSFKNRLANHLNKDLSGKTLSLLSCLSSIEYKLCLNESILYP